MKARYVFLAVALAAAGVVHAQSADKSGKSSLYSEGATSAGNVASQNPGSRTGQRVGIPSLAGTVQNIGDPFDPFTQGGI